MQSENETAVRTEDPRERPSSLALRSEAYISANREIGFLHGNRLSVRFPVLVMETSSGMTEV